MLRSGIPEKVREETIPPTSKYDAWVQSLQAYGLFQDRPLIPINTGHLYFTLMLLRELTHLDGLDS
jgi:hypothetical protein